MEMIEKNLAVLPEISDLYNQLHDNLYQCEQSKTGQLTLRINNVYVHSRYDPERESSRVLDYLIKDKNEIDIYILYGSGLGYILHSLYQSLLVEKSTSPLPYIIYIEKDINLFLTSLCHFDWTGPVTHDHVKLFVDSPFDVIGSFIQEIPTKRIRYYYHRPTYIQNEQYYREVQNHIHYILDRKDMNTATFQRFQKLWTRNFIYNIPNFLKSRPIDKLRNLATGATAAVIAGGPTVEQCIPFLKKHAEGMIIIAVDTVFKYLKSHGIIPDIVVTIDPQYWNYKYLENEDFDETIIVTDALSYYKIFQLTSPHSIFTPASIFPIVKYFDQYADRGTVIAGGSVSTTAFEVARFLNTDQILLCGLDLSFPGRNIHFRGAFFETRFLTFQTYFNTSEKNAYSYLAHVPLIPTVATSGMVFTDKKMLLFKKWFDREILNTEARVLLPNHGGVKIEGAMVVSLEQVEINMDFDKQGYKKEIEALTREKAPPSGWTDKIDIIITNCDIIAIHCRRIIAAIPCDGNITARQVQLVEKEERILYDNPERKEVVNIISSAAQDILLSIKENVNLGEGDLINPWISTRELYSSILDLSHFFEKKIGNLLKIMGQNPNI